MRTRLFVIGAQRSGTSWLSDVLHAHRDVVMARPARPEPKLFLAGAPDDAAVAEHERRYFAAVPDGVDVLGEKCTSYFEHPEVADAVQEVHPGALFLAVLRSPVQRALSNVRFSAAHGLERRPVDVALDPDVPPPPAPRGISVSPFDYLARSRYVEHLEPWLRRCGPERLRVVFLSELTAPGGLDEVRSFLGLSTPLVATPDRVNASPQGDHHLDEALRERLERYFEPHDRRLTSLLGRDLPWSG